MPTFIESTDAAGGIATNYTLGIGQTAQGQISSNGDHDWYRVNLVAGQTYTFSMVGTGTNNVQDTYLRLYDATGLTAVTFDDDTLEGNNSQITYTAVISGSYYLDAGSYDNVGAGQYGVSATTGRVGSFDIQMGAGVIDTESAWSAVAGTGANITYGFRASGGEASNFSQLTAAQIMAVQSVFTIFTEVCGLTFNQVNAGGYTNDATMLFSNYSANDGAGAYAQYPGSRASSDSAGDVYLNTSISKTTLPPGSYSHETLIHEIGHAVGLSHPGRYNAGPNVTITYANNAQFIQDSEQYTVMSYFDEFETTGVALSNYPQTLMLFDIYALQQIYGVNNATRTANSVYGFNSNVGGVYDFSTNAAPALCIWDGAGNDTLDLSGFSSDQTISLVGGTFSSVGGYASNVSIALGAVIENAVGGAGADIIVGNSAVNILDGGAGNNTLSYAASTGGVAVNLNSGTVSGGDAAGDTVRNFENATGGDGHDVLIGTTGVNILKGNAGNDYFYTGAGSDTAYGGAGVDVFLGDAGSDVLYGGDDTDYIYGGAGSNNVLSGDGGVDVLYGQGSNDYLYGGEGGDYLYSFPGATTPTGYGGNGNDIYTDLAGGTGSNDIFYGEVGQDYFYGNAGNDVFYGGAGVDVFLGGDGNDIFDGGGDVDYAWGGAGRDTYNINTTNGPLVINDFSTTDDIVRLVGTGITSFADVQSHATYYAGLNTTILSVDADTSVWFIGLNATSLTVSNFVF
jgi:serralysin